MKLVRAIGSDFFVYENEWESLVGIIMHFLNNSPSPIKAGFTPNQLFLGEGAVENVKYIDDSEYFVALKRNGKVEIIEPRNVDDLKKNLNIKRNIKR